MEAAIRIIPSAAVGAANIWLVWLSLVFLQAEAADSAQADLDFFYILVRAGVPITVFSVAVVLGTYLSKEEGAKYWRMYWGINAMLPTGIGTVIYGL